MHGCHTADGAVQFFPFFQMLLFFVWNGLKINAFITLQQCLEIDDKSDSWNVKQGQPARGAWITVVTSWN